MKHFTILTLTLGAVLLATPAAAMRWAIYAPDDPGTRYWIDRDSIHVQGSYTYFTIRITDDNSNAPETADGTMWALNCATGDSLKYDGSSYQPGPNFGAVAHLRKFVCGS